MPITLKKLELSEIDNLLQMMNEFYIFENIPFVYDEMKQLIMELLNNTIYGEILLIKLDDIILGYVVLTKGYSLEYKGIFYLLDEFYIKQDFRSKGYGTSVINYLKYYLSKKNANYLLLEVDNFNNRAYQLYIRNGFIDKDRKFLRCKI